MKTKQILKTLQTFASNDSFRPSITSPYFDGENIVATDGHRLFSVKAHLVSTLFAEGLPKEPTYIDIQKDSMVAIAKDVQFPNYKRTIPEKTYDNSSLFTVPEFIGKLGSYKKMVPIAFLMDSKGEWQYRITDSAEDKQKALAVVNATLLATLADVEGCLSTGDLYSPVIFAPKGTKQATSVASLNWYAVVMRIRVVPE